MDSFMYLLYRKKDNWNYILANLKKIPDSYTLFPIKLFVQRQGWQPYPEWLEMLFSPPALPPSDVESYILALIVELL